MGTYKLFCRGESGNAYKAALMLNLTRLHWAPVFVDFFSPESRATYRRELNEMGEIPTLELPDGTHLSQSAVILTHLSELTGKFRIDEADRLEGLRWMLFDNHKFTPPFATLRFMVGIRKVAESPLTEFLRMQAQSAFEVVDEHLATRSFMLGERPTIVDISMVGYHYYDEEARFDRGQFRNIEAWKKRISALAGWRHPYELMPRALPAPVLPT
jgi:glutathione S-transferase